MSDNRRKLFHAVILVPICLYDFLGDMLFLVPILGAYNCWRSDGLGPNPFDRVCGLTFREVFAWNDTTTAEPSQQPQKLTYSSPGKCSCQGGYCRKDLNVDWQRQMNGYYKCNCADNQASTTSFFQPTRHSSACQLSFTFPLLTGRDLQMNPTAADSACFSGQCETSLQFKQHPNATSSFCLALGDASEASPTVKPFMQFHVQQLLEIKCPDLVVTDFSELWLWVSAFKSPKHGGDLAKPMAPTPYFMRGPGSRTIIFFSTSKRGCGREWHRYITGQSMGVDSQFIINFAKVVFSVIVVKESLKAVALASIYLSKYFHDPARFIFVRTSPLMALLLADPFLRSLYWQSFQVTSIQWYTSVPDLFLEDLPQLFLPIVFLERAEGIGPQSALAVFSLSGSVIAVSYKLVIFLWGFAGCLKVQASEARDNLRLQALSTPSSPTSPASKLPSLLSGSHRRTASDDHVHSEPSEPQVDPALEVKGTEVAFADKPSNSLEKVDTDKLSERLQGLISEVEPLLGRLTRWEEEMQELRNRVKRLEGHLENQE
eukprot:g3791.t1